MTSAFVNYSRENDQHLQHLFHDATEMMKDNVTQMELTLPRIAMVQVVRNIWDAHWVKSILRKELNDFWDKYQAKCIFPMNHFHYLIAEISDRCRTLKHPRPYQHLNLPASIVDKLVEIVEEMGIQIVPFLREFSATFIYPKRRINSENCKYALEVYGTNIQWTITGRIDYGKSIKTIIDKLEFVDDSLRYCLLCKYCLEDEIEKWYMKIRATSTQPFKIKFIEQPDYPLESLENFLMAYWNFRYETQELIQTRTDFFSYYELNTREYFLHDAEDSIDLITLRLCLLTAHTPGIDYFWSRLDENTRNIYFWDLTYQQLYRVHYETIQSGPVMDSRHSFLRRLTAHQCCELLDSMPLNIRNEGLISLITWPWRDFLFPTFETWIKYQCTFKESPGNLYVNLLEMLCFVLEDNHELSGKKRKCRELIYEIVQKFPTVFRRNWMEVTPGHFSSKNELILVFLQTKDMELIRTLFNHDDLGDLRPEFLECVAHIFSGKFPKYFYEVRRAASLDFKILEQFKQEVLLNDCERRDFSCKVEKKRLNMDNIQHNR